MSSQAFMHLLFSVVTQPISQKEADGTPENAAILNIRLAKELPSAPVRKLAKHTVIDEFYQKEQVTSRNMGLPRFNVLYCISI